MRKSMYVFGEPLIEVDKLCIVEPSKIAKVFNCAHHIAESATRYGIKSGLLATKYKWDSTFERWKGFDHPIQDALDNVYPDHIIPPFTEYEYPKMEILWKKKHLLFHGFPPMGVWTEELTLAFEDMERIILSELQDLILEGIKAYFSRKEELRDSLLVF